MSRSSIKIAVCAAGEIWGGVERFVLTTVTGLRAAGMDVRAVLFHDAQLAESLRDAGVPPVVLDRYGKYDPRAIAALRAVLRACAIDVLHVHGYKATVIGGLAARGLAIKVVKTEHGRLEPFSGWRHAGSYARMAANVALDRVASRLFLDAQVFVSRDIERRFRFGTAPIVRRLIYNGVEPPAVSARPDGWHERSGRFDVGIVGRIDKVKGHQVLFAALRRLGQLDRLRLHVFGTGPLEQACRREAAQPPLAGRVVFHGFDSAVHTRMARLDLLVMPSLHEGLPYALLEAMYLKVPVLASRVGGVGEILADEACGELVEANDPAALAAAIERLYHDAGRRARLAARGHAVVQERFLARDMVWQYRELYRQLLHA